MKKLFGLLLCFLFLVTLTACGEKKEEKKENKKGGCDAIVGGSYTLSFVTNDEEITFDPMTVCIACAPDSYEDLPTFDNLEGWYYDSEFTEKVEGTSSKDVTAAPLYGKETDCITGYRNLTLYAKIS